MSLNLSESLGRKILEGCNGRITGGGRHSFHLSRRVRGGANATETSIQKIRRETEGERDEALQVGSIHNCRIGAKI